MSVPYIAAAGLQLGVMVHQHELLVDFGEPYDLPRTLGVLQRGQGDPAVQVDRGSFGSGPAGTPGAGAWICRRVYSGTGEELGQVTYRLHQVSASAVRVRTAATSESLAVTAAHQAHGLLGGEDDWTELELLLNGLGGRISKTLAEVRRRHPGVRLPATGALFDQLVVATLEQKVTHQQARHTWRHLLRRHGQQPPGFPNSSAPEGMRLPLSAAQLRHVPSWQWHQMWVQPQLAKTVLRVAERAAAVHRLGVATPLETRRVGELSEQLTAVPGIGRWTTAEALQRSHGAADLPAVGDFHLAHFVGEALTGRRTDDAGMLELLEPFRPHRQRIIRLLKLSGFRNQRFGPRLAPEDHRRR